MRSLIIEADEMYRYVSEDSIGVIAIDMEKDDVDFLCSVINEHSSLRVTHVNLPFVTKKLAYYCLNKALENVEKDMSAQGVDFVEVTHIGSVVREYVPSLQPQTTDVKKYKYHNIDDASNFQISLRELCLKLQRILT